jgi:hypothetical protein
MAEHTWTVLCGKRLVDPETDVMSLIDITESLTVPGLADKIKNALEEGKRGVLVEIPMQIVSFWFRSNKEEAPLQARFVLYDPAGERLLEQPVEMQWGQETSAIRLFVNLPKFPATSLGFYRIVVENLRASEDEPHWSTVATVPFFLDAS